MNRIAAVQSCAVFAAALLSGALAAPAQIPDFVLASQGCAMAHCDVRMSDNANTVAPMSTPDGKAPVILYTDPEPRAGYGVGCASNTQIVACSYRNLGGVNNVVVYDGNWNRKYASGNLFNYQATTSVPMVATDGSVIACDDRTIIRFDPPRPDGLPHIRWQKPIPGGTPVSPVLTANGVVILGTNRGPITAFSVATGDLIGTLIPTDAQGNGFHTLNTVAVNQNRIYVAMSLVNNSSVGR